MRPQALAKAELEPQVRKQDEAQRETYRKFAHHFPAATRLEGDEAQRLREEVIAGYAAGQSFAGRDLTGIDGLEEVGAARSQRFGLRMISAR